jgi:AraC-like DNA-binding protein/quercetin dioxygenase-like cupin family protein
MPRPRPHARPAIAVGSDDATAPRPDPGRPVRVRARSLPVDTHFEPHHHAWAQLAYCASGIVQVTVAAPDEVTYIVPPSRAVWIAPGARHAVHVLEAAEFRSLYIDASATPEGWAGCRMLVVSNLLRELIHALDAPSGLEPAREALLAQLVLDELCNAHTQALGVPMPHPQTGDKRLRALCEAVLRAPAERPTLADWAVDIGASERTVARLFRTGLGTSYQQWRQQAVLAHALPLLARGTSISQVAAATGYASDSAFSAMFKAAMGQSPSSFTQKNGT